MSAQLMAIVAQGDRNRIYFAPTDEHERIARSAITPDDVPDTDLPQQALGFRVQGYGMTKHRHLFTDRQLVMLCMLADLVSATRDEVLAGGGGSEYADAVATYMGMAVGRIADMSSTLVTWIPQLDAVGHTFTRQALPMVWDSAECNPIHDKFRGAINWVANVVQRLPALGTALVHQGDAATETHEGVSYVTDPPYYDNIGYADLSDYFYVWLRRGLRQVYPDLFSTLLVPKSQELIAEPSRHSGSRKSAEVHFEKGMRKAFVSMCSGQDKRFPMTVVYAFKQAESEGELAASTGWETMLEGLVRAGLCVNGTWPMRTERSVRTRGIGSNALASSIVLVCRPRPDSAPLATRKEFLAALKADLPQALRNLQQGSIAPVDLAQSAIGPGMGVFSRYAKVVEADGSAMSVRTALGLINGVLDETLGEQESDFDGDTRWALAWFEEVGMGPGAYGLAETLSKAKNTSIGGLVEAGILESRSGKVRLLDRREFPGTWDPAIDARLTVWEVAQNLILALETGGEAKAAELLRRVGGLGETAKELAYRLYVICERKKWAKEALAYNALVVAWPEIARLAAGTSTAGPVQEGML